MDVLTGRVVVVAGTEPIAGPIAVALCDAGARVALVALSATPYADVSVHFRADPAATETWARVSMYVEQHLGPVDAAVTDKPAEPAVRAAFESDLRRRGHGDVVVVTAGDDPAAVVVRVAGTQ